MMILRMQDRSKTAPHVFCERAQSTCMSTCTRAISNGNLHGKGCGTEPRRKLGASLRS